MMTCLLALESRGFHFTLDWKIERVPGMPSLAPPFASFDAGLDRSSGSLDSAIATLGRRDQMPGPVTARSWFHDAVHSFQMLS